MTTTSSPPTPEPASSEPDPPPRRRRFDPLTLAALTSIALAVAIFVTWIIVGVFGDDEGEGAVDVRDALELPADAAPAGTLEVGQPAPEVTFDLLGDGPESLASLQGSPVVINFWSSTCAPCLAEMPDLEAVHQQLGDDVAFVGVDVTDTEDAGRQMVERTGVTYPNARDPQADVLAAFGGTALPRTVLIDRDGTVADVHNGALSRDELLDKLDAAGMLHP